MSAYEDKAVRNKGPRFKHLNGLSFEQFLTEIVIKEAACMTEGIVLVLVLFDLKNRSFFAKLKQ